MINFDEYTIANESIIDKIKSLISKITHFKPKKVKVDEEKVAELKALSSSQLAGKIITVLKPILLTGADASNQIKETVNDGHLSKDAIKNVKYATIGGVPCAYIPDDIQNETGLSELILISNKKFGDNYLGIIQDGDNAAILVADAREASDYIHMIQNAKYE